MKLSKLFVCRACLILSTYLTLLSPNVQCCSCLDWHWQLTTPHSYQDFLPLLLIHLLNRKKTYVLDKDDDRWWWRSNQQKPSKQNTTKKIIQIKTTHQIESSSTLWLSIHLWPPLLNWNESVSCCWHLKAHNCNKCIHLSSSMVFCTQHQPNHNQNILQLIKSS